MNECVFNVFANMSLNGEGTLVTPCLPYKDGSELATAEGGEDRQRARIRTSLFPALCLSTDRELLKRQRNRRSVGKMAEWKKVVKNADPCYIILTKIWIAMVWIFDL